ncbi:hypothetical protein CerSpe_215950 [Prunus speciosa]
MVSGSGTKDYAAVLCLKFRRENCEMGLHTLDLGVRVQISGCSNQKENDDQWEMMEEVQRSLLFRVEAQGVYGARRDGAGHRGIVEHRGSSEEMESPRSVGRWRQRAKREGSVHSQILRIREEDAHLGESTSLG